jgi:O-antigen ligase
LIWFEIATGAAIQSLLRRAPGQAPAIEAYNRGATTLAIFFWPAMEAIRHRWGKMLAGVGLVVSVAAIGMLMSATAQLAVLVGGAAYLLTSWMPRLAKPALAVVTLALVAMPLIVLALPPVGQVASAGPAVSHSGLHRLVIWRFVAERIAERPLLGWGFDSARAIERSHGEVSVQLARPDAQGRTELIFYEVLPLHPHNMSLQIWLETGLIGVMLIVAAAWIGLRPVLSRLATAGVELAPVTAMIAAGLVVGSLGYGIWQGWWVCSLWLVAALVAMSAEPTAGIEAESQRETAARAAVGP